MGNDRSYFNGRLWKDNTGTTLERVEIVFAHFLDFTFGIIGLPFKYSTGFSGKVYLKIVQRTCTEQIAKRKKKESIIKFASRNHNHN